MQSHNQVDFTLQCEHNVNTVGKKNPLRVNAAVKITYTKKA